MQFMLIRLLDPVSTFSSALVDLEVHPLVSSANATTARHIAFACSTRNFARKVISILLVIGMDTQCRARTKSQLRDNVERQHLFLFPQLLDRKSINLNHKKEIPFLHRERCQPTRCRPENRLIPYSTNLCFCDSVSWHRDVCVTPSALSYK